MKEEVKILNKLRRIYRGRDDTFLSHRNHLQLMVSTILSAQCTDERVNMVTKDLFKKYRSAEDFANANIRSLTKDIKSITYFNSKARNIKAACRMIIDEFGGKVPGSMEDLVRLPGVGRKTANIIMTDGMGQTRGIAVDTHVARVAYRLGWTSHKVQNRDKIEKDLMETFPKDRWRYVNKTLISHGREVCKAPVPTCSECPVKDYCPRNGVAKSK